MYVYIKICFHMYLSKLVIELIRDTKAVQQVQSTSCRHFC